MSATLSIANAQIVYDRTIEAVRDVSLTVNPGSVVCLLGSNGAGKTTLLKAISGILYPEKGDLLSGSIHYGELNLGKASPDKIVANGIVQVPEGRRMFSTLTVEENLIMGGFTLTAAERERRLENVYEVFPDLAHQRKRIAGYLSGGQQQMVAIGRALMAQPSLLMLDEPSLGLAPIIIEQIFEIIPRLPQLYDLSVLLVEQNARLALQIVDYGYVLERGRVVFDGDSRTLLNSPEIQEFYLGMSQAKTRRTMKDIKHYKRRKRWLS